MKISLLFPHTACFFFIPKFHFCPWTKISERVFRSFSSSNSEKVPKFSFKAKNLKNALQNFNWKAKMKNQGVKKRREEWEEKFWTIILPHSKAIVLKDSSVIFGSRRKDWWEFSVLERAPYFWICFPLFLRFLNFHLK
jgi:hypothetical protein